MLQDVFGLIGEHVDMDIDRRRHIEGNEEGSSEQCVEGKILLIMQIFVSRCLETAKNWMTMNEPKVIASCGYDSGIQAPGRCSKEYGNCAAGNSGTEPYIVGHNLLLSHAATVQRYRQKYQGVQNGRIGILPDFGWYEPITRGKEDNYAAQRARDFHLGCFSFWMFCYFGSHAWPDQAGGTIASLHKMGVPTTNDHRKLIWFRDYESTIKSIYCGTEFLESVEAGKEMGVVLESTSFYCGQIFDIGSLQGTFGKFEVYNVQYGGFVLHIGSLAGETSRLSVGDKVVCKEVLGDHVDQKGSIILPEKLRFDFSHGKPAQNEKLRKIETIVNDQIKAELDVYAKEVTLSDAKCTNGLRAVFGEELIYQNTKEAKAFALISEEGIAKGVHRVTVVTAECAFEALELAHSLDQEVIDAAQIEGSMLEKKVASLQKRVDAAPIPAAKKNDIRAKISLLQEKVRKGQKKIAEVNMQKAVKAACEKAEVAV
ncbi:hypothetical protein Ancab_023464 [Ancistrocladus abbreviatus]